VAAAHQVDELLLFAAGAVEAPAPRGFWVWELPRGREVQLAFSPHPPRTLDAPPAVGFWIGYHVRPRPTTNQNRELTDFIALRLGDLAPQATPVAEARTFYLGDWLAVEQDFSLPAVASDGSRDPARTAAASEEANRIWGRHIAARTPWGIFEVHARAPLESAHGSAAELADWLSRVKLNPPREETLETRGWTADAEPILGCWKAYRSRMRLFGDGRIEILSDAPSLVIPDDAEQPVPPPRRELLIGQFRAQGDLLFVEWQDGSPLNLRWKLHQGELLLTDHDGQTSRLLRIYE
jgi:hypothetical protein